MSDSVKFIFMTLIKVPCIIFAAFFIFNIFAFFFIYFKVLGFSYVVMQEVVENNYINNSSVENRNNYSYRCVVIDANNKTLASSSVTVKEV